MKTLSRAVLVAALCLLAACSTPQRDDEKLLDKTLDAYAAAVRWGNIQDMVQFLAPDATQPTAFEIERLNQLQIAGYREQPPVLLQPGVIEQVVQIDFVNRHTQEMQATVERMRWRFDADKARWVLVSGLPRLHAARR
jgi:hypothetical protein